MKTFKAPSWDSDADEDHTYQELFKGSPSRKKKRKSKFSYADEEEKHKKLNRMLKKRLKNLNSNDVNVITVQTKIELGKSQDRNDYPTTSYETPKHEKKLRKKCKKSKAEIASDSDDSEEEITKKQRRLLKKYSSQISSVNRDSGKPSADLLRERKRQKKLRRRLEKEAKKREMMNRILELEVKKKLADLDAKMKNKVTDFDLKKVKKEPVEPEFDLNKVKKEPIEPDFDLKKVKKEPIDDPPGKSKPIDNPGKSSLLASNRKVQLIPAKEKPISQTIPEPLRIIRKIKLQEKLKAMLEQAEKRERKPVLTLREKMMEKLKAARFRFLNEQIYKTDSREAQRIFRSDPEAFMAYHEGYRQQVKSWPVNPVDVVIKTIRRMPRTHIVADFGCGDAKLANCVEQKVHSFDLMAINKTVIACDMAHVPLASASIDVGVFCLSLMGTNLHDYLLEANRVLKLGGILKIAEVASRFENVDNFIEGVQRFGFRKSWKDFTHNLFYFMDFRKIADVRNRKKLPTISLLPCLYKKR